MSKLKICPGDGRQFIRGKRVLIADAKGRLKRELVCLVCASKAERILPVTHASPCMGDACDQVAVRCDNCSFTREKKAAFHGTKEARDKLRPLLQAAKIMQKGVVDGSAIGEFVKGRYEGLLSAWQLIGGSEEERP